MAVVAGLLSGILDAPWMVVWPLILVGAVLVVAGGVLTIRANRLFRDEGRHDR